MVLVLMLSAILKLLPTRLQQWYVVSRYLTAAVSMVNSKWTFEVMAAAYATQSCMHEQPMNPGSSGCVAATSLTLLLASSVIGAVVVVHVSVTSARVVVEMQSLLALRHAV